MITNVQWQVLLVGTYFCDLVFTNLPEFPRLGHEVYARDFHLIPGGVFTPAVSLHRLGVRVAWPCIFGADVFSQWVKTEAVNSGVSDNFFDDSGDPALRITTAFSFGEERAFLSYAQNAGEPDYPNFIKMIKPDWVYVTNLKMGDNFLNLVRTAREVNSKIFMDCQAHGYTLEESTVRESLSLVDVFSPNATEARFLTGCERIEKALAKLAEYVPMVIIKDGSYGCVYAQGNSIDRESAIDVAVVDTTGAGDNFNCGFLYGQLRGFSLQKSLRIANICGGLSVQAHGGTGYSISESEVLSRLD